MRTDKLALGQIIGRVMLLVDYCTEVELVFRPNRKATKAERPCPIRKSTYNKLSVVC